MLKNERETQRDAYPLTWEQQRVLFAELPDYLYRMALFKVNTGCREQEVCRLCWDHEIAVPELDTTVFLIPWNFGGVDQDQASKIAAIVSWCSIAPLIV